MNAFIKRPPSMASLIWLALLLGANLCVGQAVSPWLKGFGAILLVGVLPGLAFNAFWFTERDELDVWEQSALALGSSILLSAFALWLYSFWPGRLSLLGLLCILNGLSLALAALALWRQATKPPHAIHARARSHQTVHALRPLLLPLGLMFCAMLLSFLWLGYSEWEADEIPVVNDALALILGDKTAIYRLAKGPTQTLLTAAWMLMGHSLSEGFLRLPFAASAVAVAAAFWMVARRILPQPFAQLALFWLCIDGFFVSKARVIQFPMIIFLSDLLSFYALWRALQAREAHTQWRWQLLGSAFFAFGLFTHYTGAFIAPALMALWLASAWPVLRQRATWWRAASLAATIGVGAAPFYWLMFQQPRLAGKAVNYYVGFRVGSGPFNNIPDWAGMMRMYESPYALLWAGLGLALCLSFISPMLWRVSRLGWGVFISALLGMGVACGWPQGLSLASLNLSFAPFVGLAICLCLVTTLSIEMRALWLWLLAAFAFPVFWMQVPGDHYNSHIPPLLLLAPLGWRMFSEWLSARAPQARIGRIVKIALFSGGSLSASFTYLMFLSQTPEYATLYPSSLPAALGWLASEAPVTRIGIPHNNGWRTVAALYEQGLLRGEYETNEFIAISEWYRAVQWRPPTPQPRYYFYVIHPQPLALASDPPAELLQSHTLWGEITVHGEPRIRVYQRRAGASVVESRVFALEAFDAQWQTLTTLSRFVAYKDAQRDESAFHALARQLETTTRPGDAIIFDGAWARGALTRFYRGDTPMLDALAPAQPSDAARVWGVFWASPERALERALATQACPATSQWFGNIRLSLYGAASLNHATPVEAQLGDVARLQSFALSRAQPRRGAILCAQLVWQTSSPTENRHKVFVHLVNAAGQLSAQADVEPLAGFAPTTEWQAGQSIVERIGVALPDALNAGVYQLFVGLYAAQSGVRLPAHAASGARYPNDAIPLGSITLE